MTTEQAADILTQSFTVYEIEALKKAIAYAEAGNDFYLSGSIVAKNTDGMLCG